MSESLEQVHAKICNPKVAFTLNVPYSGWVEQPFRFNSNVLHKFVEYLVLKSLQKGLLHAAHKVVWRYIPEWVDVEVSAFNQLLNELTVVYKVGLDVVGLFELFRLGNVEIKVHELENEAKSFASF